MRQPSPRDSPRTGTPRPGRDQPRVWLPAAAVGLFLLAGAAAASYAAQYRLVYAARDSSVVAGLEAAIPDAAAAVFASLGVALAMRGCHAIRARLLNIASADVSVFMNVTAAAPGLFRAAAAASAGEAVPGTQQATSGSLDRQFRSFFRSGAPLRCLAS